MSTPSPAPLPTREVGRTGLRISTLGLGGAPLGNWPGVLEDDEARATVHGAWAAGVRYFDTAPLYGHGLSEHRMGFELRKVPREDFVLSTKVGRLLRPVPRGPVAEKEAGFFKEILPFSIVNDYSYDALMRSVEDSLQRLALPRVDILYIHNIDPANHPPDVVEVLFRTCMQGAYKALVSLRDQGVIRAFGVGNNQFAMCHRFGLAGDFNVFMLASGYTLLDQGALEHLLPLCAQRGISLVIAAPYCSGILVTGSAGTPYYKYRQAGPEVLDKVRRMESICARHGVPLGAAALQFPLGHPNVAAVAPGAVTAEQAAQNAAFVQHPIPPALWAEFKEARLIPVHAPTPG